MLQYEIYLLLTINDCALRLPVNDATSATVTRVISGGESGKEDGLYLPVALPACHVIGDFHRPPQITYRHRRSHRPTHTNEQCLPLQATLRLRMHPRPNTRNSHHDNEPLPLRPRPQVRPTTQHRSPSHHLQPSARRPQDPPVSRTKQHNERPLPTYQLQNAYNAKQSFNLHALYHRKHFPRLREATEVRYTHRTYHRQYPPRKKRHVPASTEATNDNFIHSHRHIQRNTLRLCEKLQFLSSSHHPGYRRLPSSTSNSYRTSKQKDKDPGGEGATSTYQLVRKCVASYQERSLHVLRTLHNIFPVPTKAITTPILRPARQRQEERHRGSSALPTKRRFPYPNHLPLICELQDTITSSDLLLYKLRLPFKHILSTKTSTIMLTSDPLSISNESYHAYFYGARFGK